jgi:pimeloyl-ACP methyl ester carboxylesterase
MCRWCVRVPVQSSYGSPDPLYPPAAWRRLQRLRPDWAHVRLPDIGHVPQLDAAREFTAHFTSCLAAPALLATDVERAALAPSGP